MGRLSRTKYILRNTPERVAITRRHHPLKHRTFEVLMSGKQRITIRLADGTAMRIPRDWTDADGVTPDGDGGREGFFAIESLRQLINLVDALSSRATRDDR